MAFNQNTNTLSVSEPEINMSTTPEQYPVATPVNETPTTPQSPSKATVLPPTAIPQQTGPHAVQYVQVSSRNPVVLTYCPKCAHEQCPTKTRTKSTGTTWVCVLVGVVVFWPLCWVPLVMKRTKQTNHYCQSCGEKVGRVKPFN